MAVHIHPLDIPPRYYKPIGQILVSWNLTEVLLSSIIWHFHKLKDPRVGRLFLYRLDAIEKLSIFMVTAKYFVSDQSTQATMLALHREADKLRSKRNDFAHGFWGRMPKEYKTWKMFFLKNPEHTVYLKRDELSLQQLKDWATRFRKLNKRLDTFRIQIGAPPP
jgi:hypothetical protein